MCMIAENMDSVLGEVKDVDALHKAGYNPAALAVTLSSLPGQTSTASTRGWFDDWTDVECADGSKARILKNPEKAFELYASEWSSKFKLVTDLLDQARGNVDAEFTKKIVLLFNNLDYVQATLRDMYKSAYLTFAATPCNEKAQEEKRKMDRIISAASLHLVSLKIVIEGVKDHNDMYSQFLKVIDKIIDLITK
jgi:hypothetical protein